MSTLNIYSKEQIDANVGSSDDTASSSGTLWARLKNLVVRMTAAETDIDNLDNAKQDLLVSGTTIKTINSNSLLGSGDISISGSGVADSVKAYGGAVNYYETQSSYGTDSYYKPVFTTASDGTVSGTATQGTSGLYYALQLTDEIKEAFLSGLKITGTPSGTYYYLPLLSGHTSDGNSFGETYTRYSSYLGSSDYIKLVVTDGIITSVSYTAMVRVPISVSGKTFVGMVRFMAVTV